MLVHWWGLSVETDEKKRPNYGNILPFDRKTAHTGLTMCTNTFKAPEFTLISQQI